MRMRSLSRIGSLLLFGAALSAQSKPLANADVIRMLRAGLSEGTVAQAVSSAAAVAFDTSPDGLIALKTAGVPESVISLMITRELQAGASGADAPSAAAPSAPAAATEVEVPDGTPVPLRLTAAASSATSKTGDPLRFTVPSDVRIGNVIVIRRGAEAIGKVSEARPSGRFGRAGSLKFEIESVTGGDGKPVRVRFTRDLKGSGNLKNTMDVAAGAAKGDTGSVVDSAAKQVLAKGSEVSVRSGTQYEVYTDGVHRVTASPDGSRRQR